jgi:glycosyltransferase involved in cell wall biosynthesis
VAASAALRDRLSGHRRPIHLLTHGVDVDLFSRIASAERKSLNSVPKPRAGFFGLIDARTDQELLAEVARLMPHISFVLAGPVVIDVQRLSGCANVHFTGALPYSELPSLITGLDVLLIPYKCGALANSLSPLKLKEYLVTGKPILSTPITEVLAQSQHVAIGRTAEEWVRELKVALTADLHARRRAIIPSMESESWSYKAQIFIDLCAQETVRAA